MNEDNWLTEEIREQRSGETDDWCEKEAENRNVNNHHPILDTKRHEQGNNASDDRSTVVKHQTFRTRHALSKEVEEDPSNSIESAEDHNQQSLLLRIGAAGTSVIRHVHHDDQNAGESEEVARQNHQEAGFLEQLESEHAVHQLRQRELEEALHSTYVRRFRRLRHLGRLGHILDVQIVRHFLHFCFLGLTVPWRVCAFFVHHLSGNSQSLFIRIQLLDIASVENVDSLERTCKVLILAAGTRSIALRRVQSVIRSGIW